MALATINITIYKVTLAITSYFMITKGTLKIISHTSIKRLGLYSLRSMGYAKGLHITLVL